jgi:hypothetical protein
MSVADCPAAVTLPGVLLPIETSAVRHIGGPRRLDRAETDRLPTPRSWYVAC